MNEHEPGCGCWECVTDPRDAPSPTRCTQSYNRKHYLTTECPKYAAYIVEAYGSEHRYCRQHAQQAALNAADAGATATVRKI